MCNFIKTVTFVWQSQGGLIVKTGLDINSFYPFLQAAFLY